MYHRDGSAASGDLQSTCMNEPFERLALRNAERLLSDAELLSANGRSATAVAIAILAIEEIGKAVMHRLSSDPDFRHDKRHYGLHRVKQAIASTVLVGGVVMKLVMEEFGPVINKMKNTHETDQSYVLMRQEYDMKLEMLNSDEFTEKVAREIYNSTSSLISEWANSGVLDLLKQGCLYVDYDAAKHGRSPFLINADLASHFIEKGREALSALDFPLMLRISRALYRLQLTKGEARRVRKPS